MPATVTLREAVPADDAAVGELLVRCYAEQYARKLPEVKTPESRNVDLRDQAEKRANGLVLVAEHAGRIVGTVWLVPWGSARTEAWIPGAANIRNFAVDAAFRGGGVSRQLLDETERRARAWNAPAICLHVRRGALGIAQIYVERGYSRDPAQDLDHLPQVFLEASALIF
jgi:GNAT superfamily N-acetyltransferase